MRRFLVVAVAALAILGIVAPAAQAQAPAPKVTIDGFLDQTTSWSSNMSIFDLDLDVEDDEWYGRSRGQFQITGEVGKVKGFLKFEQDNTWGNVGNCNGLAGGCTGDGGPGTASAPFARRDGGLNTEIAGNVEMLWIYTEFPFSGGAGSLLPFLPVPGTMRLGIQPFVDETYKLSALATGQFGGLHLDLDVVPGFRFQWSYVQIDEAQTGRPQGFFRGDDFATIFGFEISPMMDLKVKPLLAYYSGHGTAGAPRQGGRGGVADSNAFFPRGAAESRVTIGVDAKWAMGPFSLAPTFLYQFGERDIVPGGGAVGTCGAACVSQDISAFLIDIRGGWRSGPLEVEGLFTYSPGNDAKDNVGQFSTAVRKLEDVNFYQAIDTYSGWAAGWGSITALMHDYLINLFYNAGGLNPATSIGYDKYGRLQLAARAFYSLTPNFKLRGVVTGIWTAEEVDTDATAAGGTGLSQTAAGGSGDDDYIGTEVNIGFDWNFAPNISLYAIYGHLFAGDALANLNSGASKNVNDVDVLQAVVRYSF